MNKEEIKNTIKKYLPSLYGEDVTISETDNSVDWNFNKGEHMCSLKFVDNKYDLRIDKTIICGMIDNFSINKVILDINKKPNLKFLEDKLNVNLEKLWKDSNGKKLVLIYEDGEISFTIERNNSKNIILYKDGKIISI